MNLWFIWLLLGFFIGFFIGIQPKISRSAEAMYNICKEK